MSENITDLAAKQLLEDWPLQLNDTMQAEEIIQQLSGCIIRLLDKGPEAFFHTMYRLDVSEQKLNAVLHNKDVAQDIARLIYNRQVQKIETKAAYKEKKANDDPELAW